MTSVMATPVKIVYAHITHNPKVLGGRACIDNTRIRVLDIVQLLREGKKPEEMLNVFAVRLTLAQVHAALAYYYDYPDEIETGLPRQRALGGGVRARARRFPQPPGEVVADSRSSRTTTSASRS